jgi:hypothetical protein
MLVEHSCMSTDEDTWVSVELETHRAPNILKEGQGVSLLQCHCDAVSPTHPFITPYVPCHVFQLIIIYMVMFSDVAVSNKPFISQ